MRLFQAFYERIHCFQLLLQPFKVCTSAFPVMLVTSSLHHAKNRPWPRTVFQSATYVCCLKWFHSRREGTLRNVMWLSIHNNRKTQSCPLSTKLPSGWSINDLLNFVLYTCSCFSKQTPSPTLEVFEGHCVWSFGSTAHMGEGLCVTMGAPSR